MKLIVGLGNPGDKYTLTRHNTGFLAVDQAARLLNVDITKKEFEALTGKTKVKNEQIILMKPQTYMNESGRAIRAAVEYYHLNPETDILVLYDDLDLKIGNIRLRESGSAGGHNGIKSIIANLGTNKFDRIRIGIDKDPMIPIVDYVLGRVKKEDVEEWQKAIENAAKAAVEFTEQPFQKVMNKYNALSKEKNG